MTEREAQIGDLLAAVNRAEKAASLAYQFSPTGYTAQALAEIVGLRVEIQKISRISVAAGNKSMGAGINLCPTEQKRE